MHQFHTIYDFQDRYMNVIHLFLPLPLAVVGFAVMKWGVNKSKTIGKILFIGGSLFTVASFFSELYGFYSTRNIYKNRPLETIEGPIQNLNEEHYKNTGKGGFNVGNIGFSFNDFTVGDFSVRPKDVDLKNNQFVKVIYYKNGSWDHDGPVILKMESE